ncbi:zinc ribbon domain-containing protein [Phenylobacterium sp. LjRoot225]|uniref:Zn-ribbon domain-containing OB-fold protein n=1 Tax=Phenylobacterium sp. LjRoot225 TaxID=3342285 RepID=UPI003ED130D3
MPEISRAPDLSALEIPIDPWTQPFWDAAAEGELLLPRCGACRRFRWPPGPFCPHCQSQQVEWTASGPAQIYAFTIVRNRKDDDGAIHVPALIEFPEADGVRLLAAITNSPLSAIHVGAPLTLGWSQAVNAAVPVFRVRDDFSDQGRRR